MEVQQQALQQKIFTGFDIAEEAVSALHDPTFVRQAGYCQMFVRQVIQITCGSIFDEYWRSSAADTMRAFYGSKYVVWEASGGKQIPSLQDGDGLYKGRLTSGPFGHVGFAVNGKHLGLPSSVVCVCENSSYHVNPDHMGDIQGAKGWRSFDAFGPFEMIVRWSA